MWNGTIFIVNEVLQAVRTKMPDEFQCESEKMESRDESRLTDHESSENAPAACECAQVTH